PGWRRRRSPWPGRPRRSCARRLAHSPWGTPFVSRGGVGLLPPPSAAVAGITYPVARRVVGDRRAPWTEVCDPPSTPRRGGPAAMRVVVALGGNALLRRGEALTSENQRANVRVACEALAPVAMAHELVVSHGNGPQVGLLAEQAAAYDKVPAYPLDILGAETQGMIGYLVEQELGNRLPKEKPLATLLTMIQVDEDDPAFDDPTKPIGPVYDEESAAALARERGW